MKKRTILILAANPKDTPPLRLDEEVREISLGLERAKKRDEFELKQVLAARPKDVRRAMLDLKPSIVHFCGHGSSGDGIAFENESGYQESVNADALAGFFELFSNQVECVVLNACYSELQAQAISKHIKVVIGMNKDIEQSAAVEFAVAFYDAIGAGEDYQIAYKFGCNAIQWGNLPDHLTPKIKYRHPPGGKIEAGIDKSAADDLKYYLYISKTKIDMLYNQLSATPSQEISKYQKLNEVLEYLNQKNLVGTIEKPGRYFKGECSLAFTIVESTAVFCGKVGNTLIGLTGSKYHLEGAGQPNKVSLDSISVMIFPSVARALDKISGESKLKNKDYDPISSNMDPVRALAFVSWNIEDNANSVEFVARVLKTENIANKHFHLDYMDRDYLLGIKYAIIASPLYVAFSE